MWKASDTRLDRIVAIKVSKGDFTERFEREARAISALNHPNICHLYDVGPNYLVMEFIEGTPLKGPMPVPQAIEYASQILDALAAAHKVGITHRDLKPANVLVTKHGIKLLDFGLAKKTPVFSDSSETLTAALTQQGQIVGTLQYMAPEQLQGKEADARSDIFAFGCVLYEMISGRRAFQGASAASLIGAILEREPAAIEVAPPLDRVIRTCLNKDADKRFQSALDLKHAIAWAMETSPSIQQGPPSKLWIAAAAALSVLALAGWFMAWNRAVKTTALTTRLVINPPNGTILSKAAGQFSGTPEISPDGKYIAFSTSGGFYVRKIDSLEATPFHAVLLVGDRVSWSPDSQWLLYFSGGKLTRVKVADGVPEEIRGIIHTGTRGVSINSEGTILIGGGARIQAFRPADGSAAEVDMLISGGSKAVSPQSPFFLPDGEHFLFHDSAHDNLPAGIYVAQLTGTKLAKPALLLTASPSAGRWANNKLYFMRGDSLYAQTFRPGQSALEGEPELVAAGVTSGQRGANFSASNNGVVAYRPGKAIGGQLTWFNRNGERLGKFGTTGDFSQVALSPDEKHATLTAIGDDQYNKLLLCEVDRPDCSILIDDVRSQRWGTDGHSILYSTRRPPFQIMEKPLNLQQPPKVVAEIEGTSGQVFDVTRDRKYALISQLDEKRNSHLYLAALKQKVELTRVVPAQPTVYANGRFSPDGNWIVYFTAETGEGSVYVQSLPLGSPRRQLSSGRAYSPSWRADGKEILYMNDEALFSVAVEGSGMNLKFNEPKRLMPINLAAVVLNSGMPYAITRDGSRILIPEAVPQPQSSVIAVLVPGQ